MFIQSNFWGMWSIFHAYQHLVICRPPCFQIKNIYIFYIYIYIKWLDFLFCNLHSYPAKNPNCVSPPFLSLLHLFPSPTSFITFLLFREQKELVDDLDLEHLLSFLYSIFFLPPPYFMTFQLFKEQKELVDDLDLGQWKGMKFSSLYINQ